MKSKLRLLALVLGLILSALGLIHYLDPVNRLMRAVESVTRPYDDELSDAIVLVKVSHLDQRAVAGVMKVFDDPNPLVRKRVIQVLGGIKGLDGLTGDPQLVVPLLLKALADPDSRVRQSAVVALAKIRPLEERVICALTEARRDSDRGVRNEVVEAFVGMGPTAKSAVPMLIEALSDRTVAHHAIRALGGVGPDARGAIPILLRLSQEGNDDYDRCFAAEALWRIEKNPDKAVPILIHLLQSSDLLARREAAGVLGEIGPPAKLAIPALIEAAEHEPAESVVRDGEAKVKQKGVIAPIAQEMSGRDFYPQVREAALAALRKITGVRGTQLDHQRRVVFPN